MVNMSPATRTLRLPVDNPCDARERTGVMMVAYRAAFIASALVVASARLNAQAPATIGQIPVYAGAVRDAAREAELLEDFKSSYASRSTGAREGTVGPIGHVDFRAWRIKAPTETVAAFYRERLAARDRNNDAVSNAYTDALSALRPGKTTLVTFDQSYVNLESRASEISDLPGTEAKLRAAYVRARPPFAPNQWIGNMDFEWNGMDAAKRQFHGTVSLEELGGNDKAYVVSSETRLEFMVEIIPDTLPTPEETAPVQSPPLPEPAAAKLGVQKYPGARYDAAMSGAMSSEEATIYVYYSTDPMKTVRAFYERTTGKQGELIMDGAGASITVVGNDPFPKLGVVVSTSPPQLAPVKTVISIRHGKQP